ncbi:hypothetical protein LSM04_006809 [Trypanosoma melophagium]|uniref:uncharacterized protein n=1 Tax=Trypanosoma melophagium TaxID=715481 RepID=UPI00351A6C2F|nr:hypothetical protein LSM04_006809 [Trypanosoma melophagium]
MSIEELRREVEEQESFVESLRRAKAQREELLTQLRELMQCAEPKLFAELNDDVHDLICSLTEKQRNEYTTTHKDLTDSDTDVKDLSGLPLFSKEMEERIMQEEEPSFPDHPILFLEHDGGGKRRSKKKKKKNKESEIERKKTQYVDPCRTVFSARELIARDALLAAVDAIQIECKTLSVENNGDKEDEKIPIWLNEENEKENIDEDPYYSDDFE